MKGGLKLRPGVKMSSAQIQQMMRPGKAMGMAVAGRGIMKTAVAKPKMAPARQSTSMVITKTSLPSILQDIQTVITPLSPDTVNEAIKMTEELHNEQQRQIDTINDRIEELKKREIDNINRMKDELTGRIDQLKRVQQTYATIYPPLKAKYDSYLQLLNDAQQRLSELMDLKEQLEAQEAEEANVEEEEEEGYEENNSQYGGRRRRRKSTRRRRTTRRRRASKKTRRHSRR